MSMHACPHCGGPCISSARKLFLGPAFSARCATCGYRVSVAFLPALLAALPCMAVAILGLYLADWRVHAAAFVLAGVAMCHLHLHHVPLVTRFATGDDERAKALPFIDRPSA